MNTKVMLPNGESDVRRWRDLIPNKEGKNVLTYTIVYDGAQDDTNERGQNVTGAEVGKHGEKSKTAGVFGNRDVFPADVMQRSGALAIYDQLNGTNFAGNDDKTTAEGEDEEAGKTKRKRAAR